MCGIAGFFTGCRYQDHCSDSAEGNCRLSLNASGAFERWHEKATVRSMPRRVIDADDSTRDMFPRQLTPIVSHPLFHQKYYESISEFLCLQLYRYLNFTINLELLIVNPNIIKLSRGADVFKLTDEDVIALHKMYVDEGYHALFCIDMAQQLEALTNFKPKFDLKPSFMRIFEDGFAEDAISNVIFTAVSETLITSNLTDVARDKTAPEAVSKLMQDHARDESRHHAFFKGLILRMHCDNPLGLRRQLHLIPKSIMAFIEPDRLMLRAGLLQIGVTRDDADQIIDETYPQTIVQDYARSCSRDLINFLTEHEITRDFHLLDEMHNHNLIGA